MYVYLTSISVSRGKSLKSFKTSKKIIDKKSKLQILKFRYLEKFLNDFKYNASFKIIELRAFILDTFFYARTQKSKCIFID